jgi:hypothetical protein
MKKKNKKKVYKAYRLNDKGELIFVNSEPDPRAHPRDVWAFGHNKKEALIDALKHWDGCEAMIKRYSNGISELTYSLKESQDLLKAANRDLKLKEQEILSLCEAVKKEQEKLAVFQQES